MSNDRQGAGAPAFQNTPWHVTQAGVDAVDAAVIADCKGNEVMGTSEWCRCRPDYAQLFAAAPDLYEALYRLSVDCRLAGLEEQAGFDCWLSMADKALAKARGEA
ncbi:hypothetical protein DKP76_07000 [Falsochrobactrum shanghaiense]|uniref:Uncharacterized protein n=1 Tax=Falsochrobactrum shanghaiense TaxID=2201899 RepID=A0A316JBH6_9HYPH|nr:hypothetical protein [Falsochrobactrum shanghaiense]PWL18804.1 hypothetical protein DKP76_07000 [Falsochrobactrum shanghaiense]